MVSWRGYHERVQPSRLERIERNENYSKQNDKVEINAGVLKQSILEPMLCNLVACNSMLSLEITNGVTCIAHTDDIVI